MTGLAAVLAAIATVIGAVAGLVKTWRSEPVRRARRARARRVLASVPPPAGEADQEVKVQIKQRSKK